ncbi:hypothetical protein BGZ72_009722 [Mortierella alpina]|nr:hypothetical protein BGZ72_009722 [Mortierella alpina]
MDTSTSILIHPPSNTIAATAPVCVVMPVSASARALAIPEILEHVLALLGPSPLLQAALVCQQWYQLSLRFTTRSTTWDDATTKPEGLSSAILGRSPVHRVLRCNFSLPFNHRLGGEPTTRLEADERWRQMLDRSPFRKDLVPSLALPPAQDEHEETLGRPFVNEPCSNAAVALAAGGEDRVDAPSYSIKSLYLTGFVHKRRIPSILFHISTSLTTLSVRFEFRQTIDLLVILQCPRLVRLNLENCTIYPFGTQADALAHPVDFDPTKEADQRRPLKGMLTLQNLTLTATTISPPSLQYLLRHSSDLRQFRFRSTLIGPQRATYHEEPELVRCLGKHCPRLDLLQLSQLNSLVLSQQSLDLLKNLPRLRGLCLFDREFSNGVHRSFLPSESPLHVQLTSLCIEGSWKMASHPEMDDLILHQFLCQCPTLLHLYAYDIFLDVSRLESSTPPSPPLLGSDGRWTESAGDPLATDMWACRDLKTLQLSFKRHNLDVSHLHNQHRVLHYIPRVCPRLEHLQIDLFKIDFVAESGLSLLSSVGSGLPALETLGLGTRVIRAASQSDVAWLRKTSPVLANKGIWPWSKSRSSSPTSARGEEGVRQAEVAELMVCEKSCRELWPRLTKLRLFYDARDSHTLSVIRQLEELVSSVRPGVDFRVAKHHELEL